MADYMKIALAGNRRSNVQQRVDATNARLRAQQDENRFIKRLENTISERLTAAGLPEIDPASQTQQNPSSNPFGSGAKRQFQAEFNVVQFEAIESNLSRNQKQDLKQFMVFAPYAIPEKTNCFHAINEIESIKKALQQAFIEQVNLWRHEHLTEIPLENAASYDIIQVNDMRVAHIVSVSLENFEKTFLKQAKFWCALKKNRAK